MQEFSLQSFVEALRKEMYIHFPYEWNKYRNDTKHPNRTGHIRDVAFMDNQVIVGENNISFDIGNARAEAKYPYYHILQDAPIIHKRPKSGEPKSDKGSQSKVRNLGQRDYGRVSFNRKTYSKEYAKNVRGKRDSVITNARQWVIDESEGGIKWSKTGIGNSSRESQYYKNIHYQYINRILELSIKIVAPQFGYRLEQVKGTSLKDDYEMQQEMDSVLEDMINSFTDYDEGEEDYE